MRNNLPEALSLYQAILDDRTVLLGSADDPGLAVDWNNLSSTYEQLQRFDQAASSARRAMQLFAAKNGTQHPRMAWLHNALGFALLGLERLDEAHAEFEAARQLALAKLDANNSILLNIHVGLGRVAQARGEFGAAHAAFAEALRIGMALNHSSLGAVEIRLGLLLLQQERYREAEAILQRGIKRSEQPGTTVQGALELQGSVARGVALAHLGRIDEGEALAVAALARLGTMVDTRTPRYTETARLLEALRQSER
jgi:tetratricopeptide (TPR) repeat protein